MRISSNLQQVSSTLGWQKTGQQQGAKSATEFSKPGSDAGKQLTETSQSSEDSTKRLQAQAQSIGSRKAETANVSTVGFALQRQATGSDVAVDTNSANQVTAAPSQTTATAKTQNQGATTGSPEFQRDEASQRLGALLNRLGSTTQTSQNAEVNSNTVKFAESYSKAWANRSANRADVSAQEQADEMTKLYQQTQANAQLQQTDVSALAQANQTTSQVQGLFRG